MLQDDLGRVSYSIGLNVGLSLAQKGFEGLDAKAIAEGLADALRGEGFKMEPREAHELLQSYMHEMEARRFEKNIKEADAFFAVNAKKEGVVTLESGLQYQVLVEGKGACPKATDTVTTHYHGTLINGTVFDSSVQRGQPASFPVNGVIKGWVEALQLMPIGSKWRLFVPSELAYGAHPHPGGPIEPHMALIFEVELISIN